MGTWKHKDTRLILPKKKNTEKISQSGYSDFSLELFLKINRKKCDMSFTSNLIFQIALKLLKHCGE